MNLFQNHKVTLFIVMALLLASILVMVKKPPTLGLDLSGGSRLVIEGVSPNKDTPVTPDSMDALRKVIQLRVDSAGVSETVIQDSGDKRIIIEIPGEYDSEKAKARIGKVGNLEFKRFKLGEDKISGEWVPSGISGKDLAEVDVGTASDNSWSVNFTLNKEGAQKMKKLTEELIIGNQPLGIFFDGEQQSAPSVRGVISDQGQITGSYAYEEAKEVVDILNAGALPLDITFIEESSVSPLLGKASINQSFFAGLGGLVAVLIFMVIYYRIQGLVASLALVVYTFLTYAAYNLLGVTFTLAGIAGFILSIGMAVDANILIFERTKEEIKLGRSLGKAIDMGFDRAFPSIFDSNTTTIITCVLLWVLGTGSVKGFALTLAIGVLISMFSAINVTRTFMHLILGSGHGKITNPSLFGIRANEIAESR